MIPATESLHFTHSSRKLPEGDGDELACGGCKERHSLEIFKITLLVFLVVLFAIEVLQLGKVSSFLQDLPQCGWVLSRTVPASGDVADLVVLHPLLTVLRDTQYLENPDLAIFGIVDMFESIEGEVGGREIWQRGFRGREKIEPLDYILLRQAQQTKLAMHYKKHIHNPLILHTTPHQPPGGLTHRFLSTSTSGLNLWLWSL